MKTNKQKTIKAFQTARATSNIKPVLQCINVQDGWLTCTDGYRLHSCKDLTGVNNHLPNGNYNPDTMEVYTEDYPNHKTLLFSDPELEVYKAPIEALKANFMACGILDIKRNTINFLDTTINKKYVEQAITFLDHFVNLTKCNTIAVFKKNSTGPLIINLYDNTEVIAYALIMPVRD